MLSTVRKSVLAGVCLACMGAAASAADIDPAPAHTPGGSWYLRGDLGVAFSDADGQPNVEEAFAAGAGIGYRFNQTFRADITFDGAFDYGFGGGVDSYGILANIYADLPFTLLAQPYIGGGIGWGEVSGNGITDDGVSFAAMAGFSHDLSPNLALDIGYKFRYTDLSPSKTGGVDFWIDHMIRAGLRFSF